jgi:hypothetical protein
MWTGKHEPAASLMAEIGERGGLADWLPKKASAADRYSCMLYGHDHRHSIHCARCGEAPVDREAK